MRPDRRTLAFALVALAAAALFVRLGVWQLDRHGERAALNELREARRALPPLRIASAEALRAATREDPDALLWRRLRLVGRWDYANELLLRNRSLHGRPGVHVVTPFLLSGSETATPSEGAARRGRSTTREPAASSERPGSEGGAPLALLVRRGWLPAADGLTAPLSQARPAEARGAGTTASATVEGLALPAEQSVSEHDPPRYEIEGEERTALVRLDPEAAASALPYPVAGFTLLATEPEPAGPAFRPLAVPEPDAGPHLLYALQWFAFAGIALIGTGAWIASRRKTPGEA